MIAMTNELGSINILEDVVAKIAGRSIEQCYGIVGMAAKKATDGIVEMLNRENYARGIILTNNDGALVIDMYVIVEYGTSIVTVAESAMQTVKYNVETYTGLTVDKVNVIVEGIRI